MQWIGALLAAGGCALLGALCARRLDARERAMEFWENALARMASAVETGGAGLPEILRAGADGGENTLAQAARLLEEKPALSQGDWLSASRLGAAADGAGNRRAARCPFRPFRRHRRAPEKGAGPGPGKVARLCPGRPGGGG